MGGLTTKLERNGKLLVFVAILSLSGSATMIFPGSPATVVLFPAPAYCAPLGTYASIAVPVESNAPNRITGIVFAVLHNAIGQTLQISTGTVYLSAGENTTVNVVVTLAYGSYTTDVFIWSVYGASYSQGQHLVITC